MKTLLLAPELFATDSGIPRILRLYLKALCELVAEGDEVRFVSLNDEGTDFPDLPFYSTPALGDYVACGRDKTKFTRAVFRLARGTDLVVCGHIAQLPVAWLTRLFNPRLRTVLVAHGIEVWRPFNFWERLALRRADHILCVSEFTRREMLKNARFLHESRLVVLPNALDPRLEPHSGVTAPPADQPSVILTVSRLSAADSYKGIDFLIEAMPAIRATVPGAKLRIVGRGDDAPRLQALVQRLKLGASVEFAGFVPDTQLPGEFAACTLFALPSAKEGFGLVYLEALAAGRPCLVADAGGAPEIVTPDCGRVVPCGQVDALASAVLDILRAPWDPAALRARAQEFSFPRFKTRLATVLA